MKAFRFILIALTVVFAMPTMAQVQDSITSDWFKANYQKREVMITMRDGVKLFTSIYEPKDKSVKHPTLMTRTCYSAAPYGEDNYGRQWLSSREYVRRGYILVTQDVRGKNKSDGEFEDLRPFIENKKPVSKKQYGKVSTALTDEASDTYDTVEWLINNTNSNGCVGVYGISYPGFYSTMAALSGHPALKAVSPQAPVTDWFRGDDAHHNGAFFCWDMFKFQYWFEYLNNAKKSREELMPMMRNMPSINHSDAYTDYLKIGAVKNLTTLFGDSVSMWNNVINHPDLDDYWESHNVVYHLKNVKPAIMVVGGLFDAEDCYGAFQTYKTICQNSPETETYFVEGPWAHGLWSRGQRQFFGDIYFGDEITSEYYNANIELPFFEYYLNGKGEKPQPGARVFDTGSLQWHYFPKGWPGNFTSQPFYLQANGTISQQKPATQGELTYTSDPTYPVPYTMLPGTGRTTTYMLDDQRFAARRPDVLTFTTPVLTEPLQLSGEVSAELQVSLTTTDADFVVKIIDVFPDDFSYPREYYQQANKQQSAVMAGYQMLVRGEVMRGKYRNDFAKPEPFVPGQTTTVKFTMPDVSHTFMPGHKLMIQVQSSWFPLVDRNPQQFCNIYKCDDGDFIKSDITIHCSPQAASCIWLPVVK